MKDNRLTTALAMMACLLMALLAGCERQDACAPPPPPKCYQSLDHLEYVCQEHDCWGHSCNLYKCESASRMNLTIHAATNVVEIQCP